MSRRTPRRIDEGYLRRVALWYLERWEAPRAGVARALDKRIRRAVETHGQDADACRALADGVLDDLERDGLIDDLRYARALVARHRERGSSRRRIQAALAVKGVEASVAREAMAEVEDDAATAERHAAIRLARRRRFGPWRRPDAPDDVRRKELASMARAGFSYGLATQILDADDPWALEDELPRGW